MTSHKRFEVEIMKKRLLPKISKNLLERIGKEFLGVPSEEKDPLERINDPIKQRNASMIYGENLKAIYSYMKNNDENLVKVIEIMAEGASDPDGYKTASAVLYYIFATAVEDYLEKNSWETGMLKPGEIVH
jgi:hypothetical protein